MEFINVDELLGPIWLQVVGSVVFLSLLYQFYFWTRYMSAPLRREKKIAKGKVEFNNELPPLSVIISARDEAENLRNFLSSVLEQDYPEFEVIVVNDSSFDDTEFVLDDYQKRFSNFRRTFVPDGTRNISTKKLALTLGVKAAKYDWLVFTDADCHPAGNQWLRSLARNFGKNTEIVLGYGAYQEEKSFLNSLITFDTLFNGLQYLGFALTGKPYMGVGRNMAYKKELFYSYKGFSSHAHLKSGDDDLMINRAANSINTQVECSPGGITWSVPKKSYKSWMLQKERHLSVSMYYKTISKTRLALEPVVRLLFYVSLILLIAFAYWPIKILAGMLYLLRFGIIARTMNRSSRHFGGRSYYFRLFVFDIWLPLVNLFVMTSGRMGKKSKYIDWK